MALSTLEHPVRERNAEETVIDWRMVAVGGGLVLFSLMALGLVLAWVLQSDARREPAPQPEATPVKPLTQTAPVPQLPMPPLPSPRAVEPPPGGERSVFRVTKDAPSTTPTPRPLPARSTATRPAPVPQPPAVTEAAAEVPRPERRQRLHETALAELLASRAKEVDLDAVAGTTKKLRGAKRDKGQPSLDLLADRGDLRGLPVRRGADCQADAKATETMSELSRQLRLALARPRAVSENSLFYQDVGTLLQALEKVSSLRALRRPEAVPPLVQMFQGEGTPQRLVLVRLLEQIPGPAASAGLVHRALFDLSDDVREVAVIALQKRPREETRAALLNGLRYPWAPVADHAAEALLALDDREALPRLVELLDLPDPNAPARGPDRKWTVPELVRVNHLRNCLLCHAPSTTRADPVRGLVPTPGQPIPQLYYDSGRGDFVRADVTYLRQDFSVQHPVADAKSWPELQRFDYIMRAREVSAEEAARLSAEAGADQTYPQREAVLFALRGLSGQEAGSTSAAWRQTLADLGRKQAGEGAAAERK